MLTKEQQQARDAMLCENAKAYRLMMMTAVMECYHSRLRGDALPKSIGEYLRDMLARASMSNIYGGGWAECDVSPEVVSEICAEWGLPDAYAVFRGTMDEALAQNRQALGME